MFNVKNNTLTEHLMWIESFTLTISEFSYLSALTPFTDETI